MINNQGVSCRDLWSGNSRPRLWETEISSINLVLLMNLVLLIANLIMVAKLPTVR